MQKEQNSNVEVLQKLRSYCSYRERASSEVRRKAVELGSSEKEIDFFIKQLEQDGFLDDQRFAELYARSKFRQNSWGKFKIRASLQEKRIPRAMIDMAITEIDQIDYEEAAKNLISKSISEGNDIEKTFQKMKMKGFEGDLIYSILNGKGLV